MKKKAVAIGVTGGIACGKTEVGRIFAQLGVEVSDADDVAHRLMMPDTGVYRKIVAHFGSSIIMPDGQLNRRIIGQRVFADKNELHILNKIVHPKVLSEMQSWVKTRTDAGAHVAGIIPLLFEVNEITLWNAIVCVSASPDIIYTRMLKRGLSDEEINMRIHAQMPLEEKEQRADYCIVNNGTLQDLYKKTSGLLETILNKENKNHG